MRTLSPVLLGLLLILPLGSVGCGLKKKEKPAVASTVEPIAKAEPKKDVPKVDEPKGENPPTFKKPPSGTIVRSFEAIEVQNMLKQLFVATRNLEAERNRFPVSREELEPYYEKNGKINQALKDGDIVYFWKAMKAEDPTKAVLAYEAQVDRMNTRMVLFANGDTQRVSEADFKDLPKVPTKK